MDKLKPFNRAIVIDTDIKHRLTDLGVTSGAVVIVKRTAPFGDPIEIEVRGCNLALRKCEAKNITVTLEGAVHYA